MKADDVSRSAWDGLILTKKRLITACSKSTIYNAEILGAELSILDKIELTATLPT